jgi:branched-chain amino acid transport system ATP-binding protein
MTALGVQEPPKRDEPGGAALEVVAVSLRFGGLRALEDVSVTVNRDEVVGLIGPNGAGKTTLLNCVTGFYRPSSGQVRIFGAETTRVSADVIIRRGVARTFQDIGTVSGIGCRDFMLLGRHQQLPPGVLRYLTPLTRDAERRAAAEVLAMAGSLGIAEYVGTNTVFDRLPYGVRKLVDLGRALTSEPDLLLMDEPGAGLLDSEKATLVEVFRDLCLSRSITVVIVDHDVEFISALCPRLVVLDAGRLIADGPSEQVLHSPEVIRAYLGADEGESAET